MFAELLLLPIKFFDGPVRQIGPLWYLSALLIIMPLFIWHYAVGRVLLRLVGLWLTHRLVVLFFVGSFVAVIVMHYISNFIIHRRKH